MASSLRFLEDRLSIRMHLEPSALGRDQLDVGIRVVLPELGGQTGRSGLVASIGAVLDGDGHCLRNICGAGRRPALQGGSTENCLGCWLAALLACGCRRLMPVSQYAAAIVPNA